MSSDFRTPLKRPMNARRRTPTSFLRSHSDDDECHSENSSFSLHSSTVTSPVSTTKRFPSQSRALETDVSSLKDYISAELSDFKESILSSLHDVFSSELLVSREELLASISACNHQIVSLRSQVNKYEAGIKLRLHGIESKSASMFNACPIRGIGTCSRTSEDRTDASHVQLQDFIAMRGLQSGITIRRRAESKIQIALKSPRRHKDILFQKELVAFLETYVQELEGIYDEYNGYCIYLCLFCFSSVLMF
jgi:hypothetical protein